MRRPKVRVHRLPQPASWAPTHCSRAYTVCEPMSCDGAEFRNAIRQPTPTPTRYATRLRWPEPGSAQPSPSSSPIGKTRPDSSCRRRCDKDERDGRRSRTRTCADGRAGSKQIDRQRRVAPAQVTGERAVRVVEPRLARPPLGETQVLRLSILSGDRRILGRSERLRLTPDGACARGGVGCVEEAVRPRSA
jgi:hypothetical protein